MSRLRFRNAIDASLPLLGLITYGWLTLILVLAGLNYMLGDVLSGEATLLWAALRIAFSALIVIVWLYSWWRLAIYVRGRLQGADEELDR